MKGIKPVPIVRADNTRYWIFRRDGSVPEGFDLGSPWTPREILQAIQKDEIEPTFFVYATEDTEQWFPLVSLIPRLHDQIEGKKVIEVSSEDVSDEVHYYKITSMISHETPEGASLLKKIDKAFDGKI